MTLHVDIHQLIILRRSKVPKLGIHPDATIPSFVEPSPLQGFLVSYGQERVGKCLTIQRMD